MIKLTEDNSVTCSDGVVLNDRSPATTCKKSLELRAAFPYIKVYVQPDCEEVLTSQNNTVILECFPIENGDRNNRIERTYQPLDDYSTESDRVKLFASIVFDAAAKAEFIASLPTVDVETDGDPVIVERVVPAVTVPKVINGVLTHVVTQEETVVEESIPATQAFIDYNGNLYAADWAG